MFYDSHAHMDLIDAAELSNKLKDSKDAGVLKIISCSTSFASNTKNILLAQNYAQIKAALGLYPLDILELTQLEIDKAFYFFNAEIIKPEIIAIGEVGLDFKYSAKEAEQEKQKIVFERFIKFSNEHKKPLIIHSRFAQRQVIEELEKHKAEKALLHSFTDSLKLMNRAKNNNYFVSVGLNILYNEEVQKNISNFPIENLLFETDSPIRTQGKKAYSSSILKIAQKTAELKNISIKDVEKQQGKNFIKLFGKTN